ncbi:hypothetical protein F0562_017194 [Nyssa sinensis]|uniref:Uncharacterized protein n=1 Tax=Nyssa sinensis TaxID=561372 RepID=A0A5J4ZHH3_9ASTE|nr:hypothetical protein F0562_017194 [Nyssa sinensis]
MEIGTENSFQRKQSLCQSLKEMYRGQQYSQIYFARLHLMRTLLYSLLPTWKAHLPGIVVALHRKEIGAGDFLVEGQNIDDLGKYLEAKDKLEVTERTLKWRHLAPTTPSTLDKQAGRDGARNLLLGEGGIFLIRNEQIDRLPGLE